MNNNYNEVLLEKTTTNQSECLHMILFLKQNFRGDNSMVTNNILYIRAID